jgi:hypothetical protein
MEERLLEYLKDWLSNEPMTDEIALTQVAKEIAGHFKEFIKWKDFWSDYDNHDTTYYLDSIDKYLTLDELYQYWLTNIYKK